MHTLVWWVTGVVLAGFLYAGGTAAATSRPGEITSSFDYYQLPVEDFDQGVPVRIQGVVLYHDPGWRLLFLRDTNGVTLYVELPAERKWPAMEPGTRLLLEGTTGINRGGRGFRDLQLQVLGPGTLPAVVPIEAKNLVDPEQGAVFGQARGTVRNLSEEDRLHLILTLGDQRVDVWVQHYAPSNLARLLDAKVVFQGVRAHQYDERGEAVGAVFYVSSFNQIRVEEPGAEDVFKLTAVPINRLFNTPGTDSQEPTRVRIHGTVMQQVPGVFTMVTDETERIRCFSPQTIRLERDQRVDVVGFPVLRQGERILEDATFRLAGRPASVPVSNPNAIVSNHTLPLIESAEAIHDLKAEAARRRYPVKLNGVVTYCDAAWRTLFIQDDSGGIFVDPGTNALALRAGQRVEVTGLTDPGGYMPMVVQPQINVLGESPMPTPKPLLMAQGKVGDYDCEWVEIQGLVQSTDVRDNHSIFRLETGGGIIHCLLPHLAERTWTTNLVGATVRVQGVCTVSLNAARLFAGLGINIPDETKITVRQRPPADLFSLPTLPIQEVLGTLRSRLSSGFVKVKGVVTLYRPGWGIYIQDATAAIFVQTYRTNYLSRGDEVEVVGFQTLGDYTPILQQARVRFLRKTEEPRPKMMTSEQLLEGLHDAQLVQVEARLLENVAPSPAPELVLQAGPVIFTAGLETSEHSVDMGSLLAGSRLRLQGICVIKAGEWRRPKSFRLLLRSTEDLEVIEAPPFLNRRRVLAFITVMGVAILASLGWVAALRRRVQIQTDQIRQRFEREAALEARYRELVENANDIIFSQDAEGRFLDINRAGERLLGFTRSEVLHKNISEMVVAEHRDRFKELCRNAQVRGSMDPFEIDVWTKDQRRLTLELSTRLLQRGDREIWAETIARNVTEKHQLELQLWQAQKMECIGQLAAGVAHDFNNLLTIIQGHTNLLRSKGNLPLSLLESVQEIECSSQRAADLTRQLLAFGRRQFMRAKVLDANQVVTHVAKILQRLLGEQITLQIRCEPRLPSIRADQGLLEQVIVNLAVNARDAMPQGGQLTITTQVAQVDGRQARQQADAIPGTYVCLTIEDNGCGMDPATMAHLFEPFFTTKDVGQGTGLGLATVYGIVRQHGGWISVSSDLHRGTKFNIYLPMDGTPTEMPVPTITEPPAKVSQKTILIVEDEPIVRELASMVLQENGFQTFEANSGRDALVIWGNHSASIDLLFTDMVMPEGISGKELAQHLCHQKPTLQVIYASGYSADLDIMGQPLKEGINFLPKPYSPSKLVQVIGNCLARH